jgi:hypothetical protein
LLVSLEGIENIDTASISDLYFSENFALSDCAAKSICAYLAKPDAVVTIENNKEGCNSRDEVKEACAKVSVKSQFHSEVFPIYPNPSTGSFTFEFYLHEPSRVFLAVHNNLGQIMAILLDKSLMSGEQKVIWNAEGLPAGIYYCRLQAGEQISSAKIVKMK